MVVNPENDLYMKDLDSEIKHISAGHDRVRDEMTIYVYCKNEGSYQVSLQLLESWTLSELWILIGKVSRNSDLCELLVDHLRNAAHEASPQVTRLPFQVKYLKGRSIQTCNLDPVNLELYPAKNLVWIEHVLRTTGFSSSLKIEAAETIRMYCESHIKRYSQMKNMLKKP